MNRRDEVTLECKFRMSEAHETLHSVKWYRIDHKGQIQDFFTYQPRSNPTVKTYPRSGIRIDVINFYIRFYNITILSEKT